MAFIQAALDGVTIFPRDPDARLYSSDDSLVYGSLFPFPIDLVEIIHPMGVQNTVRAFTFRPDDDETLFRSSLETDWSCTPWFLSYDFGAKQVPHHARSW